MSCLAACSVPNAKSFICKWPFVRRQDRKVITLKVTGAIAGTHTNWARVKATNDTNPDNNEDSDKVRVTVSDVLDCGRVVPRSIRSKVSTYEVRGQWPYCYGMTGMLIANRPCSWLSRLEV